MIGADVLRTLITTRDLPGKCPKEEHMTGTTALGTGTGIMSRTALLAWLAVALVALIVVGVVSWPATGVVEPGARGRITPTLAHVKEAPAVSPANVGALTSVREAGTPAVGRISDTDAEAREGDR